VISTARVRLRAWEPGDRVPFARINADPQVMEFLGAPMTSIESDALADRIEASFATHGFGPFAAELHQDSTFIGFVGLAVPRLEAHFTPCVEVGWRLAADAWGKGLATECAEAVLHHAFRALELESLVSFTTVTNLRSRRVMEKLGMSRRPEEDFDHPALPPGHPLEPHVLYRLSRDSWLHRHS
jgi:RimJ/RimL family protein N-acetyltransferase